MKIKSQLTLATLIVAAMFATGCQQLGSVSQQTAQQVAPAAAADAKPAAGKAAPAAGEHCHEDAPPCATKCHSHAGATPGHKHVYGCVAGQGKRPVVPKVKAKGNYKGAVSMDQSSKSVMQQYQK
ncbi:hypothetical protein [Thiothrix winogradskyi]|uniref:Lipoprotein n=1 Tax=Thiothrix winogradskyi TaxID=96472 RepID=A0ABY3T3K7_9GAMM|nr:hypothetical protein [Thiothrix winogradskyi]UJS26194.1 hypothetical protein L2Y54_09180 [Thiothrix winogradskyi]